MSRILNDLKILIIEDNSINSALLFKMLSKIGDGGFKITIAASFNDALVSIRENKFDIILLDLNLPDSAGLNTLIQIRDQDQSAVIIVITSEFDEEFGLATIANGAQDFLIKGGFDINGLKNCIYYSLEKKKIKEKQIVLEKQLIQAQKIESIGILASGIAHEINTPIQFIGNNTKFILKSTKELFNLIGTYRELLSACDRGEKTDIALKKAAQKEESIHLSFIENELPLAIDQTLEGVERVAKIVGAMKDFVHTGLDKMSKGDINNAIKSTTVISRNEWKYVADIKTDLDSNLPLIECFIDDIKQVVLNLIVNAAHSINEKLEIRKEKKGLITIKTYMEDNYCVISIRDTGMGIPDKIHDKIFDPFFTTKAVGKGTGQGLSLAYSTIVKKHKGKFTFDTEMEKGTTFYISIPIG